MALFLNHNLAVTLEENLVQGSRELISAWDTFSASRSIQFLALDDALAVYCGPDCSTNEVVGLGMTAPVTHSTLDRVEKFYDTENHATLIRVCPLADPSLINNLQTRGYVLKAFTYKWVLDLSSWQSQLKRSDERVRVVGPTDESDFVHTVAAGFADRDSITLDTNLDLDRAFFRLQSGIPMIAYDAGEPAAAGMLALQGDVAALFDASTRLSFRNRGLQTALLDSRLRYAQAHGCRIATIETDPDSAS
jgi:ribosomal protein S18 acetylase RimI-like enzyme